MLRTWFRSIALAMASQGLALLLLIALLILTFVGTVDQKNIGLWQAKKKYFDSLICLLPLGKGIGLPFPGGYLVCTLLFFNLLASTILKFAWRWKSLGTLLAHAGILLLLLGSFLTFHYAREGRVIIRENQLLADFVDDYRYELCVIQESASPEYEEVIAFPQSRLKKRLPSTLEHPSLPFQLLVEEYLVNCRPENDQLNAPLSAVTPEMEAIQNYAGCLLQIQMNGKPVKAFSLFAESSQSFRVQGKIYTLALRKERIPLPFSLRLLHFQQELYPGTDTPKHYESRVEVLEGDSLREISISMNQPLRHRGYTFYQSSFDSAQDGTPISVLSVVNNPADKGPYLACLLVFLGMVIHFMQRLVDFLRKKETRCVNSTSVTQP